MKLKNITFSKDLLEKEFEKKQFADRLSQGEIKMQLK